MRSLEIRTQRIFNNLIEQNQELASYFVLKQSTIVSSAQSPASKVQRPTCGNQHPLSNVQRRKSSVQDPASRVQRPEASIQRPESSVQRRASRVQRPAFRVQHPEPRVQHPEPSIQSSASRVQRPESAVQSPRSITCRQSSGFLVCLQSYIFRLLNTHVLLTLIFNPFSAWYPLKGQTYLNKTNLFSGHQTLKS